MSTEKTGPQPSLPKPDQLQAIDNSPPIGGTATRNSRSISSLCCNIGMQNWIALLGVIVNLLAIVIAYWAFAQSVKATRESFEQNNLATIYSLSLETHSFLKDNKSVAMHFDKWYREKKTDRELLDDYKNATPEKQLAIWHGCELIADFMQLCFEQKERLPEESWKNWLNYFCNLYEESPVFRKKFLLERGSWYTFEGELVEAWKARKGKP
jgi:hypothetical protein